jgi:DnaJ like chaperone protein
MPFANYKNAPIDDNTRLALFSNIAFEVLGHVGQAKGEITTQDTGLLNHLIKLMDLDEDRERGAKMSFQKGRSPGYPLKDRLTQLYRYYRHDRELMLFFVEIQVGAVYQDGQLHPLEHKILQLISKELRISRKTLEQYICAAQSQQQFDEMHDATVEDTASEPPPFEYEYESVYEKENPYQRGPRYGEGNYHQQHQKKYQKNHQQDQKSSAGGGGANREFLAACNILGIHPETSEASIKYAYRKLMNQHHPDKLVSRGLPPEMMELAKQKTQEIQAAYELIKTKKGYK